MPPPREYLPLLVPEHRVARRTLAYWAVRELLVWGGVWALVWWIRGYLPRRLVLIPGVLEWTPEILLWLDRLSVALLVVGTVMVVVSPPVRYQIHRWQVDEQTVYVRDGLVRVAWRIAPTARIQAVHLRRDPLELLLRLSSLVVSSASSEGPIVVVGLDRD